MTWNPDSGPFQPVPGRKFHVESKFAVKFAGFGRPGAKNKEKRPPKIDLLIRFSPFFVVLLDDRVNPCKGPTNLCEAPPEKPEIASKPLGVTDWFICDFRFFGRSFREAFGAFSRD